MIARRRRLRSDQAIRLVMDDGRLICRTEEAWEEQRHAAYDRARGLCERCEGEAPFHAVKWPDGSMRWRAGHAHHRRTRKVRDDRVENLCWLCWRCHRKVHGEAIQSGGGRAVDTAPEAVLGDEVRVRSPEADA